MHTEAIRAAAKAAMPKVIEKLLAQVDEGNVAAARLIAQLAGQLQTGAGRPPGQKHKTPEEEEALTPAEIAKRTAVADEILGEYGDESNV